MKKSTSQFYIFFAGGLTAGPVMPLLALAKNWTEHDALAVPVFFDVHRAVTKAAISQAGFRFHTISAAKFRRYLSYQNFLVPFWLVLSLAQSLYFLLKYRPKLIVGAGGFVQVPLMLMGSILRVPYVLHQQDVRVTLSNAICAPMAKKITTVFESSVKSFSEGSGFDKHLGLNSKIICVGNPSRYTKLPSRETALKFFRLKPDWPTLLVIGGGSGAEAINEFIADNLSDITRKVQVIHSVGKEKTLPEPSDNYHPFAFIDRMDLAYAGADLVMSRAGIGAISELSQFGKPAIVIPMPGTHQELNARMLKQYRAAVVIPQADLTLPTVMQTINQIIHDPEFSNGLKTRVHKLMPHDAKNSMLKIFQSVIRHD